ncbi:Ig-like domain repeat protein [Pseudomonas marginalis]|nr:Ig-like domain repeat protein [Pseudomonas marginalis]
MTEITSVANDDGGTPVPINPGETTTDSTPLIGGTSEPGSTVTIFDNGVEIGTAVTDEFGNWEFPVTTPLGSGEHSLTASSVDQAGNAGPVSNQFDFQTGSPFGATLGRPEGFDGMPSGFIFASGTPVEREGMTLTLNNVGAGGSSDILLVNPGISGDPVLRISHATMDFELKGEPANTLVFQSGTTSSANVNSIRFYDANGALIHTDTIGGEHGTKQFSMPDGLKFARFEIETGPVTSLIIDNVILANGPVQVEDFDELPFGMNFVLNDPVELDDITVTRILSRSSFSDVYVGSNSNTGQFVQIRDAIVKIDLNGQTANTLNIKSVYASSLAAEGVINFYNENGVLVHTASIPLGTNGMLHITMPDGVKFSSFEIDVGIFPLNIDDISFADVILPVPPLEAESNAVAEQVIYVNEGDEAAVLAEGSDAIDTLVLTGANQVLDLSALTAQVSSIEVIDITGTGDNTLNLSLSDVLSQGGDSLFTADEATQMMIKGNAGDVVNLDDLLADGTDPGDWAGQGQVIVEGVTYNVFQHSSLDAQLLVQDGVTTNLV